MATMRIPDELWGTFWYDSYRDKNESRHES